MKARANLRLDTKLNAQLDQVAREYGCTKSSILDTALRRFLDPETKRSQEDLVLCRLDRMDALLGKMERDLAVTNATLGHYIYYYLTQFEPHPEKERDIAAALAKKRFDLFLQQVASRLANQPSMSERMLFPDRDTRSKTETQEPP